MARNPHTVWQLIGGVKPPAPLLGSNSMPDALSFGFVVYQV